LVGGSKQISGVSLILREGMFRFDSAERASREPAAGVSLKMFDVRSGSVTELFERLYRAMAKFATHDLVAFHEGFVSGAWKPPCTHIYLAHCPRRPFLFIARDVVNASQRNAA
jgi:hypothetical protein